ncbi:hypothetical protein WICMUC_001188 [Wickerhamomyces mucosus]|uniref:Uncharacterized protein n=1 Tax=Wickerhamomyces mucosus TaxID=1378264 RepID=A0A9P8PW00_9ASCO|nr:hypothetical protein WICMUC_001188 [Wickerhamomyces mucosus]
MSHHWEKSSIPYFVVIKDQSEINVGDDTTLEIKSKNIYPNIQFIFKDDEQYDTINDNSEEDSIIVELDSTGSKIINTVSKSPYYQVIDKHIKDKNLTKTIELHTTTSILSNFDRIAPDNDIKKIENLIQLFKSRNEQLSKAV